MLCRYGLTVWLPGGTALTRSGPETPKSRSSAGMSFAWIRDVLPAPDGAWRSTIRSATKSDSRSRASRSRPKSWLFRRNARAPTYGLSGALPALASPLAWPTGLMPERPAPSGAA